MRHFSVEFEALLRACMHAGSAANAILKKGNCDASLVADFSNARRELVKALAAEDERADAPRTK